MSIGQADKYEFGIAGKMIEVYPSQKPDNAIVYMNTFSGEGDKVYRVMRDMGCPDFSLVAISGLAWDCDMAPWDIPPISPKDTPCTGGADKYLQLLTDKIIPQVENLVRSISWRGIAGYSLAGLFAVYSLYQTDIFSRVASMSGSFWFPGFMEYVTSHEMKKKPEHIYLSLGDKECRTKNPYLKTVQQNTEKLQNLYVSYNVDTFFS
ncbi:MAG: alpha/beta hydrolase-fold protein [Methanocorpusculum sp.]|nr:alpha/beta hydrolase-fold protein [Methanocorpusculum sp.]